MAEENKYRKDLPPMPERIKKLPIERGYPVPWFVAEINGSFDFRVIGAGKIYEAVTKNVCWVCGERLGSMLAFTIGPMCAVNRISAEPPAHRECAEFSIRACPFLMQKQMKRNEANLPENVEDAAGCGIKRQPGAICLWITRSYQTFQAFGGNSGLLFKIGKPSEILWFREGRAATRAEVLESIETGLPILREAAEKDGVVGVKALEKAVAKAMELLPPTRAKKKMLGSAAKAK